MDGKARTYSLDSIRVGQSSATMHSVILNVADLSIMNIYLPDSSYGNDGYIKELQDLVKLQKQLYNKHQRRRLMAGDAQVGVPPNVDSTTGQNTHPAPIHVKDEWIQRQATLIAP